MNVVSLFNFFLLINIYYKLLEFSINIFICRERERINKHVAKATNIFQFSLCVCVCVYSI